MKVLISVILFSNLLNASDEFIFTARDAKYVKQMSNNFERKEDCFSYYFNWNSDGGFFGFDANRRKLFMKYGACRIANLRFQKNAYSRISKFEDNEHETYLWFITQQRLLTCNKNKKDESYHCSGQIMDSANKDYFAESQEYHILPHAHRLFYRMKFLHGIEEFSIEAFSKKQKSYYSKMMKPF